MFWSKIASYHRRWLRLPSEHYRLTNQKRHSPRLPTFRSAFFGHSSRDCQSVNTFPTFQTFFEATSWGKSTNSWPQGRAFFIAGRRYQRLDRIDFKQDNFKRVGTTGKWGSFYLLISKWSSKEWIYNPKLCVYRSHIWQIWDPVSRLSIRHLWQIFPAKNIPEKQF